MKSNYLIFILIISFIISCNSRADKTSNDVADSTAVSTKSMMPIDTILAIAMKDSFGARSLTALSQANLLDGNDYTLTKSQFDEMVNNFPEECDVLRIAFVKYDKNKFKGKYRELEPFHNKLYIVYGYTISSHNNNPEVYHTAFSINNTIDIDANDFNIMHQNYIQNVIPLIKQFAIKDTNTRYIKIDKEVLLNYKVSLENTSADVKNIRFKLAEVVDPTKVNSPQNYDSNIYKNTIGQLTLMMRAYDNSNNEIMEVPYDDMNKLCPNHCP